MSLISRFWIILWRTARNFLIHNLLQNPRAFFKLAKSFLAVRLFHKKRIQYIEIMLTNSCNCKCDFCSNTLYDLRDRKKLLTPEKVQDLIRQAGAMDIPLIVFLGGEPLLNPHLEELVRYTHQQGIIPIIATNGQLLTEEKLLKLQEAKVGGIFITIYSTDPEVNDNVTHLPGYLERALTAVRTCKALGIQVHLKTVVNKDHFVTGEIHRLLALARELKVPISINPVVPTGLALFNYQERTLTPELQQDLDNLVRQYDNVSTHLTSNYFGYGCPAGIAYLGISAYGDVIPCFFMPFSYGNVWERSLQEIHERVLRSPLFTKGASTCVAAYDHSFVQNAIVPCFRVGKGGQIPIPIEQHPRFSQSSDTLDI